MYLGGIIAALIASCSTDVELNADWQETTVIYGLLDQNESLHFIKVNKTYLGDGSALDFAQVRDSSEYDTSIVNGVVQEIINGSINRSWMLKDTVLTNKLEGIFYGPEHTAYYFEEPALDPDAEYRLTVTINYGDSTKEVTAETELVRPFIIINPNATPQSTIGFANASTASLPYRTSPVEWVSSEGAKRYNLQIRFKYWEVTATDTIVRHLYWNLGDYKTLTADGGETINTTVDGESFFQFIQARMESNPELTSPNVIKRLFKGIDFILAVAGEDLNTYMEVNEPVTGVVQERPQFTNVTNGIGVFSSRFSQKVTNKSLDFNTLRELNNGIYTGSYGFCTDSIVYNGQSFYCP